MISHHVGPSLFVYEEQFPKLTQSIFGLSEFWSAFRQIMAMDGRNSLQNSLSPKMDYVSFGNLLFILRDNV